MTFQLIGGIGLFLLGMLLLTDGLKAFAGDALRRALIRFTGTPLKAFASGALVTAMIQSSSATTVTLIGFVSAGLLTFPQAIGVVLGASLGTTGTGWLVAVLGLKVSLGLYALPLVGLGAFMKLLARGRWRSLGLAVAGFGLIFVGIDTLQEGMQGLSQTVPLSDLPFSGVGGHVLAVTVGAAMTLVLQSSSAAVAATLTALHTGAVSFDQAAVLVIGAAIGTTVTGALAVIGGSVPAKRTALAHVLFNLGTGLLALALLPAFLRAIGLAQVHLGLEPGALSLAAFHTTFIATGVLLVLPFVHLFARGIERLLPDRGPTLTRHFDKTLLQAPGVAIEATRRALTDTACEAFDVLRVVLAGEPDDPDRRAEIQQALNEAQVFFAKIPAPSDEDAALDRRVSLMHAMDHLVRLQARLHPGAGVRRMLAQPRLQPATAHARAALVLGRAGLCASAPDEWLTTIAGHAAELAQLRQSGRLAVLQQTGGSEARPFEALQALDALRWSERVGYHGWRVCAYLGASGPPSPAPAQLRLPSTVPPPS